MRNYDIFISYRREGGYDTAKHLNDLLLRDGYSVSFDIDTLRNGDFDEQLYQRIDECKDFIVIIDPHAFDRSLDPLMDPKHDWLRCELAYALKKNKNIIPVFLSGVNGVPDNLPEDIISITQKNGPEYNRYYFNDFYKTLKARFLVSRSRRKDVMIASVVSAILLLVGSLLYITFAGKANKTEEPIPMIDSVEVQSKTSSENASMVQDTTSVDNKNYSFKGTIGNPMIDSVEVQSKTSSENASMVQDTTSVDNKNYSFKGTIGNNRISMYLDTKIHSGIIGTYCYDKYKKYMSLRVQEYSSEGNGIIHLVLSEAAPSEGMTGLFDIDLDTKEHQINGTFINSKGESFPINMK